MIMSETENIGAALVVGGGIAGIQAALDLAESGIKVYLVDNKPCIGGVMSQLDKTFPTNDCAMCTMAPRLVEIGRHKDITILTLSDIEKIEGEAGNFAVTIATRARYVDEEKCTGCGSCVEHCPVRNVIRFPDKPEVIVLSDDERSDIDEILSRNKQDGTALLSILLDVQAHYRYLPRPILHHLSAHLEIPLSQIYSVANFYNAFSFEPRGKHLVRICMGTACHARGAPGVLAEFERQLKISRGETTPDRQFTLETVNCLGCCALGPVVMIDQDYHQMSTGKVAAVIEKYRGELQEKP